MVTKNTKIPFWTNGDDDAADEDEWLVVKEFHDSLVRPEASFGMIHDIKQNDNGSVDEETRMESSGSMASVTRPERPDLEAWTSLATQVVDTLIASLHLLGKKGSTIIILLLVALVCRYNLHQQHLTPEDSFTPSNDIDLVYSLEDSIIQSNYIDLVYSLGQRIADLQESNDRYATRLSRLAMESSNWRSRAISCDRQLTEISHSCDAREEAGMNTMRKVPVAFVKKAMSGSVSLLDSPAYSNQKNKSSIDVSKFEMASAGQSTYKSLLVMGSNGLMAA